MLDENQKNERDDLRGEGEEKLEIPEPWIEL